MSRENNLAKNIYIFLFGNLSSKLLGFLLLPLYTYYLSSVDYGYFDLMSTFTMFIIPFITFQTTDGLYRYIIDTDKNEEICKNISSFLSIILKNLCIFNLLYIFISIIINLKYKYLLLLQVNISVLCMCWEKVARGLKENYAFAVSGIIVTFLSLTLNILFIAILKLNVEGLLLSTIISGLIQLLFLESKIKVLKFINFNLIDKKIRNDLIRYSLPLIPNIVIWWTMNMSDRFLINYYLGVESNGIYAIANKFPSIVIMFNTVFTLAWQETSIVEYKSNDKNDFYSKMFNMLVKLEISGVIVLVAFTKFLMKYTVGSEFKNAYIYIPILYIGAIFSVFSSFYGTGYESSKETKRAFYTSLIGGILNISINIIFIKYIGIYAAAISTMISFFAMWIIRVYDTRRYYIINIDFKCIMLLSLLLVSFIIGYYIENTILSIMQMIVSIIIFILFNKRLLQNISMKFAKTFNKNIAKTN